MYCLSTLCSVMRMGIQVKYGYDDSIQGVCSSPGVIGDAHKDDFILYNK